MYKPNRATQRFQSPNTTMTISQPDEIDFSMQNRNNMTLEVDPYDTLPSRRAMQYGYMSPLATNSSAYQRISSPMVKPQSYGSRSRPTASEDKIQWEFKSRFDDLKDQISGVHGVIQDTFKQQTKHLEEKNSSYLDYEVNKINKHFEMMINRKFEHFEHQLLMKQQEIVRQNNDFVRTIDEDIKSSGTFDVKVSSLLTFSWKL